jgi:hypothetical protein
MQFGPNHIVQNNIKKPINSENSHVPNNVFFNMFLKKNRVVGHTRYY